MKVSVTGSHGNKHKGEAMFEKVLFPTDFSEEAKTELSCITSIPGIREIILLHVIKRSAVPMGSAMVESLAVHTAEIYLQKANAYIKTLNSAIRVTLKETTSTDITGSILDTAEKTGAHLIVIHAHIKGTMTGVLLSCVSSTVLCRISKINLMIMPDKLIDTLEGKMFEKFCPMIFSRILCPINLSEYSLNTTARAGTMNGVGEIILLHVVQKAEGGTNHKEAVTTAEIRIKEISDTLTKKGIRSKTIVVTGKPESEIPRVAKEEDVSLIWMRSVAKGCLHDFFFGSIIHDVIKNATRPVIVIRSDQ
jgi:nucleotide-binding universal stress UspA family protein